MRPEGGLGCAGWWSDPAWARAETAEQKRHFVLGRLSAFNRERFMDVTYDRFRERQQAWAEEAAEAAAETDTTDDLPDLAIESGYWTTDPPLVDAYDYSPEEWQAVIDQMGATPSEVRDVMVGLDSNGGDEADGQNPLVALMAFTVRARVRSAALAFSMLAAHGCATGVVPVDRSQLTRLKDEPVIAVVHYRPPDFIVRIPEGSYPFVGGYVYLATAVSAGNKMVEQYGLRDPSIRVRHRLVAMLAVELDIQRFDVVEDALENDRLDGLRARFPQRLVLDFKTDLWTLQGPILTTRRGLFYIMRARLLRTTDGQLVWQGWCGTGRDPAADREWAELTADGGALLKRRPDEVADACAERLRAQMLMGDTETDVK